MSGDVIRTVRQATNTGSKAPTTAFNNSTGKQWTITRPIVGSAAIPSGDATMYFLANRFNFSVPDAATINGISFTVSRSGSADIYDSAVRLVKDGVVGSTDKSKTAVWLAAGSGAVYGSSSDLWGEALTADDIEDSRFGVALKATNPNASGNTAYIYNVAGTVYYNFGSNQEGRSTVYVDKFGNQKSLSPTVRQTVALGSISGILTSRFDDPGYY